jgi:hypothetical protein
MTYGQAARNWSKNAKGGRSMSVRVGGAEMRRSRSNTWSMSVGERARMEPCHRLSTRLNCLLGRTSGIVSFVGTWLDMY